MEGRGETENKQVFPHFPGSLMLVTRCISKAGLLALQCPSFPSGHRVCNDPVTYTKATQATDFNTRDIPRLDSSDTGVADVLNDHSGLDIALNFTLGRE